LLPGSHPPESCRIQRRALPAPAECRHQEKRQSPDFHRYPWDRPSPVRYRCRKSRSEEHTSELQSRENLVCRLLLEKKKKKENDKTHHNSYVYARIRPRQKKRLTTYHSEHHRKHHHRLATSSQQQRNPATTLRLHAR